MPTEVIEKFSRQVEFAGTRYITHTAFIFIHSITIYNLALSSSDETSAEVKTCTYFQWMQDVIQMGNKLVIYRHEL